MWKSTGAWRCSGPAGDDPSVMKTVGLVLAAGASQRMGTPKALLCTAEGLPLAAWQAKVLKAGGCETVAAVLGSRVSEVRKQLPADLTIVENPLWASGRVTSLQAGIRVYPDADGYLFLPVDAAGVGVGTIRQLLAAAEGDGSVIWRPTHQGGKGNLLWMPQESARELVGLPPEIRVDEWARPKERRLEVGDPAILRNVNTPEEWMRIQRYQP